VCVLKSLLFRYAHTKFGDNAVEFVRRTQIVYYIYARYGKVRWKKQSLREKKKSLFENRYFPTVSV
jgi:hypothetical protein